MKQRSWLWLMGRIAAVRVLEGWDRARSDGGVHHRRTQEGRPSSVHDPARDPLHWPHGEVAEPYGGCEQLEGPDSHDDRELTRPVHAAEETKAMAVEDRRADHRLQQVVGEGHASYGRYWAKPPAALAEQHHEGRPAQRNEEITPVVELLADQGEIQQVPLRREAPPEPEGNQQRAETEPEDLHSKE